MHTTIEIKTSVFPNKDVTLSFEQQLEVALDCALCGRTHRTVIFDTSGESGRCTPSDHAFHGQVSPLVVVEKRGLFRRKVECTFRLNYEYSPVLDRKYPHHVSSPLPTWGRVHFKATCPRCHAVSECSIQNNATRPETYVCKCGYLLYKETKEFPTFHKTSQR